MNAVLNLAILAGLLALAVVYFRFALLDHRFPDKHPTFWQVSRCTLPLVVFEALSTGSLNSDPGNAATSASVAVGLLVAPAIAPPIYTDKTLEPSFFKRLAIAIHSWMTGFVVHKAIALLVFAVCALFFTQWWFMVVAILAGLLLHAKAAALAQYDAGGPESVITPELLTKWMIKWAIATLCLAVLWSFAPYVVLTQVKFQPSSWSAFAGLGLGAVLSLSSGPR